MGYVRSRKFCCCLPVRFGAFCSALLGIVYSLAFTILGWLEIHRHAEKQLDLSKDEVVGLALFALGYTFMLLFSIMGLIGSIGAVRAFVKGYGISLAVNTAFTMGIGIFWCWKLFHTDRNECDIAEDDTAEKVEHWVCQKGFDIIRIVFVVILVVVWLFQIAGCAIVFDYSGQLTEELEAEQAEAATVATFASGSNAPMRTTYDADPIMKSAQPYTFTTGENSYGRDAV